jgi:prevent-host-death family protein
MKRHGRAVKSGSAERAAPPAKPGQSPTFTASVAKKEFGKVLELAMRGGRVFITKHATPKAVVLSVDDFTALTRASERTLDTLSGEFDALLARMQTPRARAGLKAAFAASPKAIGAAAVAAARKRG